MKKTTIILAVAYVRMSDDDQKTSIPQQKKQIQAYAKRHGFKIIKWYIDEGMRCFSFTGQVSLLFWQGFAHR